MSHAVYAFLCRGEDPVGQFESSDFYQLLDENNWHQVLATVNREGKVVGLCPEDDYRERFWLQRKLEAEPTERRWQVALEFAEEIAVWEIGESIAYLTPNEGRRGTECEHKNLEECVAALRKVLVEQAGAASGWALRRAGTMIEQAEERLGPFTTVCTNAYNSIRVVSLGGEAFHIDDGDAVIVTRIMDSYDTGVDQAD